MKILAINVLYYPLIGGGAEIIMKNLNEGLTKRGHDVYVLTFSDKANYSEVINGVHVIRRKIPNVYLPLPQGNRKNFFVRRIWHLLSIYNFSSGRIVYDVVKELKLDIVVFHNTFGWTPSAWDAVKSFDIPIVQVLHDLHFVCPTSMFDGQKICHKVCLKCKIMKLPYKIKSSKIDAVVGVSRFVLDKLIQYSYFKNARVKTVIYNSRNFEIKNVKPKELSNTVTFGFIGTVAPNKGIENLLRAFCELNVDNFYLNIAGKGSIEYEYYLKRKYENKNIKWLGYISIENFFPTIDFLVVPSIWYENFPGVVYESHYFGVPVIGSNIGGIPELIKEGLNGILFDPYNIEDLKNKLIQAYQNLAFFKEKFDEIRKSSESFFDYDGWIDKWERLLLDVCSKLK